ncbi:hypothetical protein B5X24_HaOG215474 [Helicoverpa armigera]|nr:hypothetical protein B5X24_HaOG215474 [Helicoverpa armigera]
MIMKSIKMMEIVAMAAGAESRNRSDRRGMRAQPAGGRARCGSPAPAIQSRRVAVSPPTRRNTTCSVRRPPGNPGECDTLAGYGSLSRSLTDSLSTTVPLI